MGRQRITVSPSTINRLLTSAGKDHDKRSRLTLGKGRIYAGYSGFIYKNELSTFRGSYLRKLTGCSLLKRNGKTMLEQVPSTSINCHEKYKQAIAQCVMEMLDHYTDIILEGLVREEAKVKGTSLEDPD
eukprot:sb/3475285/